VVSLHKIQQNLIYGFSKVNHFFGAIGIKIWLII
jgi:ribosomal protein S3